MKKELEKVFEVPRNLKLEKVEEKERKTVLHCQTKKQKVVCKHCGGATWGYDTRITNKHHTMVSGKEVWLKIKRKRVECKSCGKIFVEPIEGIGRSKFTNYFSQQVQEKSRGQDYSSVGREMGISCSAVFTRMRQLNVDLIKEIKKRKSASE